MALPVNVQNLQIVPFTPKTHCRRGVAKMVLGE
jgi:hypothetical protein